ncbi:MAG: SUMF1/EgtB/PvdO family nonheme iron enzyme [Candidatus Hodarchaeota archaeon]
MIKEKNMFRFINMLIICIAFISFCTSDSNWEGKKEIHNNIIYISNPIKGIWNNSKELIIEKEMTIGDQENDNNYLLVNPIDLALDENENIYICDSDNHCIKVFDANGKYIRTIGRKGQGPGEFLYPLRIEIGPLQELYVLDVINQRVTILDLEGKYLSTIKLDLAVFDMKVGPGGEIYFAAKMSDGLTPDHVIYHYNNQGQFIKSFGEPIAIAVPSFQKESYDVHLAFDQQGNLMCAYSFPYEIRFYTLDGDLIKVIQRKSPEFIKPELATLESGTKRLLIRSRIDWVVPFVDGGFLVLIEDHGPNYKESYLKRMETGAGIIFKHEFFDAEGRFLQSFPAKLNEGAILAVDKAGNVYVRWQSDNGPAISRCRLSFEKNKQTKLMKNPRLADYLNFLKGKPIPHKIRDYNLSEQDVIKQEMVLIPAGKFLMGSDDSTTFVGEITQYDFGYPPHKVYVDSFYIDKYEVTNAMYRKFVEATGYHVPRSWTTDFSNKRWDHPNQPVCYVTWQDAAVYAKWVGKRLPTEAEWEYAARGSLVGKKYPWGDKLDTTKENFFTSWDDYVTKPVGSYPPNNFGIYDIIGNANEWVSDWYSQSYPKNTPYFNPTGPPQTGLKVFKGGGGKKSSIIAYRRGEKANWDCLMGFRCVKDIDK